MVEVIDRVVHRFVDAYAIFFGVFESGLQSAEETSPARDGQDHASQLSQGLVPVFDGYSVAVLEVVEYFQETKSSMLRELDGFGDGVNNPP